MKYKALFKIKTQEILRFFWLTMKQKPAFKGASDGAYVMFNYLDRTRTVLLDCPIKAEIRAVDNQSDLRILL